MDRTWSTRHRASTTCSTSTCTVHEVTSPQAFDGLRLADRPVRRPDLTIATADHNVPTIQIERPIEDPISATQLAALDTNCGAFGVRLYR